MTIADSQVVGLSEELRVDAAMFRSTEFLSPGNMVATASRMDRMADDAAKLESLLAEAESRIGELEADKLAKYREIRGLHDERDSLQSRLDAVDRLAADWKESGRYPYSQILRDCVIELRAALGCATTGEEK